MSWHAVEISPVLCATVACAGRPAGIIDLNRCASKMRIACSRLSLLRKLPRKAHSSVSNQSFSKVGNLYCSSDGPVQFGHRVRIGIDAKRKSVGCTDETVSHVKWIFQPKAAFVCCAKNR